MLTLKKGHELYWADLQYIESPLMAKRTVQSNHGPRNSGEPVHNAAEHGLPNNYSKVFDNFGAINDKLDNGQVFLVNSNTKMPVIFLLEITTDSTAKWELHNGPNLMFSNAIDAALHRVQVPKQYGVLRDEPAQPANNQPATKKAVLEKHIILLNIDGKENQPLPSKYNITLYVENTSKGCMATRKRSDVIYDQFSSVFKTDSAEQISVYAIPDYMEAVRKDLQDNKDLRESESKGLIKSLKEISQETRSDGVVIHTMEYELQKIEIVDVMHVTGENELILLTEVQLKEIEDEEKIIQDSMQPLRDELAKDAPQVQNSTLIAENSEGIITSPIQKAKDQSIDNLKDLGVFDKSVSLPTKLTEIKRLNGHHRTWIRSDKIKNHWRKYKMGTKDRERLKGWYQDDNVDGDKLREAIASEFQVKFKTDFFKYESDKNNPLNQLHTEFNASFDKYNRGMKDITGFDASASAQFMRFAAVAGAAAELDLKEGKVAIQAQASASFDLAKGELKSEQVFPVNSRSQIIVDYTVNNNGIRQKKEINLGYLQAKIEATLSGSEGASVLLAANVEVDCSGGVPKIKGNHTGVGGEAKAFAGIRGGCAVKGSLSWADVLSKNSDWKQLCGIGKKVEGAFGIGAEGGFTFGFDNKTGKFLLRAHAGLVIGVGAAGEFLLEVDPAATLTMVHFMYEALRGVDYRNLELFDENGFTGYNNLCLFMITRNIHQWDEAMNQGKEIADGVRQYFADWNSDQEKEEEAFSIANKILESSTKGEASALLHSPPEAKGMLLDLLLFDPSGMFEWPEDDDIKRQAIAVICKTIQGGREYNEIIVRMNSNGDKRQKTARGNSERIRKSLGLGLIQWDQFESSIFNRQAPTGAPVQFDPTGACKKCGVV